MFSAPVVKGDNITAPEGSKGFKGRSQRQIDLSAPVSPWQRVGAASSSLDPEPAASHLIPSVFQTCLQRSPPSTCFPPPRLLDFLKVNVVTTRFCSHNAADGYSANTLTDNPELILP
ncbi:hypothetical protein GE061_007493 [Apolygus lucorum]|uniref:Uncharacterized protein n=1 Tax=Apolygus lucorum TaxID=248454 RepID=A0A8S9WS19_APOLU|nr:hypothetical protein GE061_007493 [Apolygus lucorum]